MGAARRDAFYANTFEKQPSAAALTALGRALFFDPSLSASGRISCADLSRSEARLRAAE